MGKHDITLIARVSFAGFCAIGKKAGELLLTCTYSFRCMPSQAPVTIAKDYCDYAI